MVAIAAGKTYLTAGGYVVEIINDELHSSERTAPGITRVGRSVLEINKDPTNTCKDGWYYEPDGTVSALTEEWTEKLRIVEELPFPIPKLPEGYEWADGFPQFREIKEGEYYVSNHYHENSEYYLKTGVGVHLIENDQSGPSQLSERKFGAKRFAVVKATAMPTPEPTKNTSPSKEYIEMHNYVDFPCYYKHRDDAFVENIKYIKRAGERERHTIKKDGSIENNGNVWCSNCDYYVKEGIWVEVPVAEVSDFIAWACVPAPKFPLYYKHRTGFTGDTAYVKRINKDHYTVILRDTGKEAENEEYKWDAFRDKTVAEGTWIEVPEAEVNQFIAIFKKSEEEKEIAAVKLNFPIYYRHIMNFLGDTKYVKRISENTFVIIKNDGGKSSHGGIYVWDKTHDIIVERGDWIKVSDKEVNDFIASVTVTGANSTLVKKEEEIEMKKETAIAAGKTVAKFAGTWGFKAANYWLFEPAVNIVRPIMKGVRYITLVGALCAAGYGYNHPEMVKNAIKSCIPKITIEAPEVLKG